MLVVQKEGTSLLSLGACGPAGESGLMCKAAAGVLKEEGRHSPGDQRIPSNARMLVWTMAVRAAGRKGSLVTEEGQGCGNEAEGRELLCLPEMSLDLQQMGGFPPWFSATHFQSPAGWGPPPPFPVLQDRLGSGFRQRPLPGCEAQGLVSPLCRLEGWRPEARMAEVPQQGGD